MNTTFTNKQEYLTYRSEWKARYKEVSQSIRDMKYIRTVYAQTCSRAEKVLDKNGVKSNRYSELWQLQSTMLKELPEKNPHYGKLFEKYKDKNGNVPWYYKIDEFREDARKMLEELKLAKIEANRQYLVSKSTETVNN